MPFGVKRGCSYDELDPIDQLDPGAHWRHCIVWRVAWRALIANPVERMTDSLRLALSDDALEEDR